MNKIRIVTDSTAYLPENVIAQYDITVVSLAVTFRNETYPEGSMYTDEEFFQMVEESNTLPTTSQPPVGEFAAAFKKLFAQGAEDIICICISSALSGTYYSAKTAAKMLGSDRIHVLDSKFTVTPQAYMVIEAAERAEKGENVPEILQAVDALIHKVKLFFVVQSLENLRKGGRIGGAAALIGTLLQVKPILYVNNQGIIDVFDKVRTKPKAWARVCQELDSALTGGTPHKVTVIHVAAQEEAEELARQLREKYPNQPIGVHAMGKVIGVHAGRGAVGLGFYPLETEIN